MHPDLNPATRQRWVGSGIKRKEDPLLLTGNAAYLDDLSPPGTLHAAILRSPHAHAKIKRVDAADALRAAGVVAVATGEDVRRRENPIPREWSLPEVKHAEVYSLATGKVRYVGEPVAAAVAVDRYLAEDALDLVSVEYEPLPPVTDPERGLEAGAPLLYEEWGTNVMVNLTYQGGDVAGAFREADSVIKERLKIHRFTGTPLETRGYMASYSAVNGSLTLWASTQNPHMLRTMLAGTLGMAENRIRVITPYVGGGWGLKIPAYQEEGLICVLSMMTGRPVKWVESRWENLACAIHGHGQTHDIEVAVKRDGQVLGVKDKIVADMGIYVPSNGNVSPISTAMHVPGPYRVRSYYVELYGVVTNKAPHGAYRGFGKADANFAMERMMDIIARELGIDPAELRLKNFIQPHEFPYASVTPDVYDSGDYPACLRRALEIANYEELRQRQRKLREEGRYMGIGIAYTLKPHGAGLPDAMQSGYDSATVRVGPRGDVAVYAGVLGLLGQGHQTTLAQVVADELGVTPDDVVVIEGDTDMCPYGLGAYSSRAAVAGAPAALLAARKVKEKMVNIAAKVLEARPGDLEVGEGRIYSRDDPSKHLTVEDVSGIAYTALYKLPEGMEPGLEATHYYLPPNLKYGPDAKGRVSFYPAYSNGAFLSVVEVDPETGRVSIPMLVVVHDCGVMINPVIVTGQIHGGVAHGLGGILSEEIVYDDNGQLLSGNFMDYLVPKSTDVPDMKVEHMMTPSPFNPGGFKGVGESGAIGPPPCIVNAVEDALAPLGVRVRDVPVTPERVFRLIQAARTSGV